MCMGILTHPPYNGHLSRHVFKDLSTLVEFLLDDLHLAGVENIMADCLSQVLVAIVFLGIDCETLTTALCTYVEVATACSTLSLCTHECTLSDDILPLACSVSFGPSPFCPCRFGICVRFLQLGALVCLLGHLQHPSSGWHLLCLTMPPCGH